MSTPFNQIDDLDATVAALREMRRPALTYLISEAVAALYVAARVALPGWPRPRWVMREHRDRPGYWWERVYTHTEVTRDLRKAWATSVEQTARATESSAAAGD